MAYDFNGTNQYLATASAPVTAPPLTMACWFNAENTTANHSLVYIGLSTSTSRFFLSAQGAVTNDPISFDVILGVGYSAQVASTTTGYNANTWNHACGVATSSILRTVYLNGGSSGTNTVATTPPTADRLTIGSRLNIGSPGIFLDGSVAEVGVWNAALTAAEIASLAQGMTCDKVRPQSLVFYAPLVRDLIDQKAARAIVNNNGATVATHPRVYA